MPGEPRPWKVLAQKTGRKMASFDTEAKAKAHVARMKAFGKIKAAPPAMPR